MVYCTSHSPCASFSAQSNECSAWPKQRRQHRFIKDGQTNSSDPIPAVTVYALVRRGSDLLLIGCAPRTFHLFPPWSVRDTSLGFSRTLLAILHLCLAFPVRRNNSTI